MKIWKRNCSASKINAQLIPVNISSSWHNVGTKSVYSRNYDIDADWHLNRTCNFNCPFCYLDEPHKDTPGQGKFAVDTVVNAFKNTGLVWHITMVGGEPFLYPHFVELCKRLTATHGISIATNLSTKNVIDFCQEINPACVESIYCSLNFPEREKQGLVEDFIEKIGLLQEKGFNIYVTQVMWPPLTERIEKIIEDFMRRNITVRPMLFLGFYKKKSYPQAYTTQQRRLLMSLAKSVAERDPYKHKEKYRYADVDPFLIKGNLSFKGTLCLAGKDWVLIRGNGDVYCCDDDRIYLGNLYEGTIRFLTKSHRCTSDICRCARLGMLLADGLPRVKKYTVFDLLKRNCWQLNKIYPVVGRIINRLKKKKG